MDVLADKDAMRSWSRATRARGASIAFVPTMGSLHEGHLSLVRAARRLADHVVVSLYVNPSQFAPHEDFASYPRDEAGDIGALDALGCDVVFTPRSLYGDGGVDAQRTWIEVSDLSAPLCGASRPHFFRGVATVVAKLFHIVEPDVAVFGDKDFQQRRLIETMVDELDMAIRIVGMPIVRETDGLAMSSRNVRLDAQQRQRALSLPKSLELASSLVAAGERSAQVVCEQMIQHLEASGGAVDYVALVDPDSLQPQTTITRTVRAAIAVRFGDVRLIDNRALEIPAP